MANGLHEFETCVVFYSKWVVNEKYTPPPQQRTSKPGRGSGAERGGGRGADEGAGRPREDAVMSVERIDGKRTPRVDGATFSPS